MLGSLVGPLLAVVPALDLRFESGEYSLQLLLVAAPRESILALLIVRENVGFCQVGKAPVACWVENSYGGTPVVQENVGSSGRHGGDAGRDIHVQSFVRRRDPRSW